MGMYTELVIKADLSESVPIDVIEFMFAGGQTPNELPSHAFFSCPRWSMIGSGSSHYHHPEAVNSLPKLSYTDSRSLFSRSDLKNYDDEISLFIDWINPYINATVGQCIGWEWYEEDEKPTLLFKK